MRLIPQTSAGIEIAGQDLRIAVVRNFAGAPRVLRTDVLAGFLGLPDAERQATLSAHFKRNKLTALNVYVTFPGNWAIVRDLEFPSTTGIETNLRSAVALQVESLSPWPLDEIYWDCVWEPASKAGSPSIVVHVGIVPRQVIDPWIQLFRAAGLALAGASLSSLSWAHGVASLWDKNRPSMILASEQGHVEGALIRNHRIYATSMEGEDTVELAQACASQLIRAGRLESPEQLRVIAHGAHAADMELETAQLPVSGNGSGENTFGAISTALLGLSRSGFRLNLIPAELRYQRNRLQFVPTYVLVGLLILVGASAWLREPYQESLYAAQLDQEAKRLSVEVRSVADQEAQLNRTADRLKALNALIANRDGNLEALRELSRLLPAGTFVTSYSYQDKVMAITGYSDSASAVQKALEGSSIFFDAQFTSSIIRDASGKDRFSLRASVR